MLHFVPHQPRRVERIFVCCFPKAHALGCSFCRPLCGLERSPQKRHALSDLSFLCASVSLWWVWFLRPRKDGMLLMPAGLFLIGAAEGAEFCVLEQAAEERDAD